MIDQMSVNRNITESLLHLVRIGNDVEEVIPKTIVPMLQKVPGCASEVKIWTTVGQPSSSATASVIVYGYADSKIAKGMLSLFQQGLLDMHPEDILTIDSEELLVRSGLQSVLPPGRLNGFQNIFATIKLQIQAQLRTTDNWSACYTEPVPDPRHDEVAILLSGGVDSSVALKLLLDQGYKVRAYYLKIWLEDELAHLNECPWEEDMEYASSVCDMLRVPLETLSLQKEYWQEVVEYTLAEARLGRTPNPDIMCNSRIKFGLFYNYVGRFHKKVATGHYAQVFSKPGGGVELRRSPDLVKDQTYFLCNLNQDQLAKALFPIGHLPKAQVRELATKFQLPTSARKDSQGICFLGKLKFDEFISHYLGEQPGEIRTFGSDKLLGHHRGLWFHTVGQRKGLGPLLLPGSVHLGPWFVAAKDVPKNILIVTNNVAELEESRRSFFVERLNWVCGDPPIGLDAESGVRLEVQLRHGQTRGAFGAVRKHSESDRVHVCLEQKDRGGIAEGQFAAFYKDDLCLGAGVICGVTS